MLVCIKNHCEYFNGVDAQWEQSGSLVQKRQIRRYKDDHNKHHFHVTACSHSKKQAASINKQLLYVASSVLIIA